MPSNLETETADCSLNALAPGMLLGLSKGETEIVDRRHRFARAPGINVEVSAGDDEVEGATPDRREGGEA